VPGGAEKTADEDIDVKGDTGCFRQPVETGVEVRDVLGGRSVCDDRICAGRHVQEGEGAFLSDERSRVLAAATDAFHAGRDETQRNA
jgi:hypothetical protein